MPNEPNAHKVSMASIGERLREAREKKSLTIDQVQKKTHIHSTVLMALEEGKCDAILPPAYVKSFLKNYCNYLGLDSKEILNKYSILHPELQTQNIKINRIETKDSSMDISKFIRIIKATVLFIVILFLITFLGQKIIGSIKKHKSAARISPLVVRLKQTSHPKPLAQKTTDVKTAAPPRQTIQQTPFNLVLKVKQNVYVKVRKDGELLFGRVLNKGAAESFKVNERLELYVAKAEAIELIIDGKSLGSPGKGVIKNLEITKKGVRIK